MGGRRAQRTVLLVPAAVPVGVLLGRRVPRVHAVEEAWLPTVESTTLHAYRFDAAAFQPFGDRSHAHVATHAVTPLGPSVEVRGLVRLHQEHGIELRVLSELGEHFAAVREAGLEFSGIRMGNAGLGPGGPFPTRR